MQKAQQARDKSVKQERSAAQALSDAQYKHDIAVADEKKAANYLSVRNFHSRYPRALLFTTCKPCR